MMKVASIRFAIGLIVLLAACSPVATPPPTLTPALSPTSMEQMVQASPAPGEPVATLAPVTAVPSRDGPPAGSQTVALIMELYEFRYLPDPLILLGGVPVRLYHISVGGDHKVTIDTLAPEAINVDSSAISLMEFNAAEVGEFAIRHLDDALTGQVVVEEAPCLGS